MTSVHAALAVLVATAVFAELLCQGSALGSAKKGHDDELGDLLREIASDGPKERYSRDKKRNGRDPPVAVNAFPRLCSDISDGNPRAKSGFYNIFPRSKKQTVRVYCDFRDGVGWTLVGKLNSATRDGIDEPNDWLINKNADILSPNTEVNTPPSSIGLDIFRAIFDAEKMHVMARIELVAGGNPSKSVSWYKWAPKEAITGWFRSSGSAATLMCADADMTASCAVTKIESEPSGMTVLQGMRVEAHGLRGSAFDVHVRLNGNAERTKSGVCSMAGPSGESFPPGYDFHWGNGLRVWIRGVAASCGNGYVEGNEVCDDGNNRGGDGCTADCKIESEYVCDGVRGGRSHCVRAATDFQNYIYNLQHPADCSKAQTVEFSFGGEGWTVGLGWVFNNMMRAMILSVSTGRTLVIRDSDQWHLARDACPSKNHLCFFEHVGSCGSTSLPSGTPFTTATGTEKNVFFNYYPNSQEELDRCLMCKSALPESQSIPWRYRKLGRAWIMSQIMRYLFKPNAFMKAVIERHKKELGWPAVAPVIGIHVRRGDKVHGPKAEAKPHHLSEYMQHADRFMRSHGARHIYISTDEPNLLDEEGAAVPKSAALLFDRREYRVPEGSGWLASNHKSFNRTAEATNAIRNIWLLSHCDFFVGTISSFFGRASVLIGTGHGILEDFASVDEDPWGLFPHWSGPTGGELLEKCGACARYSYP